MKKFIFIVIIGLFAAVPVMGFTNPAKDLFIDFSAKGGSNDFNNVIIYIVQWLLSIIGYISLAFFIYGGFRYMLAGANPALAESGKKTLKNAIIGLIIVILSYTIITVVVNGLTGVDGV
ncbi:MAG TPA: hypothetical protein VEC17_02825 [Candidatus Binatia bacterium]|nr:hypothetical protein [Candidatus Binatia bacterium]